MVAMARSVQSKDLSNSRLGNNHDSSLDVTGRKVRVDTAIDDELYKIQVSKMGLNSEEQGSSGDGDVHTRLSVP